MAGKLFSYEALTKVVQLASSTFHSRRIPTKDELFILRSEVGKLKLNDVDENLPHLIRYLHPRVDNERADVFCSLLYSSEDFDVAIFILPTGTRLPLHDHPHMTVVSKLLVGSVHWLGFDWCSRSSSPPKAYKAIDDHFSAREGEMAHVLLPREGGNLHEIRALEPSVLFDILAPPYGEDKEGDDGVRHCTYYGVEGEGETERGENGEAEKKVFTLRPLQSSSVYRNFSILTYSPQALQDYILQQTCRSLS